MMNNKITHSELKELLDYDVELGSFCWKQNTRRTKKGDIAGSLQRSGYVTIGIKGTLYSAHRLAFLFMDARWPVGDVKHVNKMRADNSWNNLIDDIKNDKKITLNKTDLIENARLFQQIKAKSVVKYADQLAIKTNQENDSTLQDLIKQHNVIDDEDISDEEKAIMKKYFPSENNKN